MTTHAVTHITTADPDRAPVLHAPGYAFHLRPWAQCHWLELSDVQIYDLCRDATTHGVITGRSVARGQGRVPNPFHPSFLGGVPYKLWSDACQRATLASVDAARGAHHARADVLAA